MTQNITGSYQASPEIELVGSNPAVFTLNEIALQKLNYCSEEGIPFQFVIRSTDMADSGFAVFNGDGSILTYTAADIENPCQVGVSLFGPSSSVAITMHNGLDSWAQSPDILVGNIPFTDWAIATDFEIGDIVKNTMSNIGYKCIAPNRSSLYSPFTPDADWDDAWDILSYTYNALPGSGTVTAGEIAANGMTWNELYECIQTYDASAHPEITFSSTDYWEQVFDSNFWALGSSFEIGDIVSAGTGYNNYYICTVPHTASLHTPGDSIDSDTYWESLEVELPATDGEFRTFTTAVVSGTVTAATVTLPTTTHGNNLTNDNTLFLVIDEVQIATDDEFLDEEAAKAAIELFSNTYTPEVNMLLTLSVAEIDGRDVSTYLSLDPDSTEPASIDIHWSDTETETIELTAGDIEDMTTAPGLLLEHTYTSEDYGATVEFDLYVTATDADENTAVTETQTVTVVNTIPVITAAAVAYGTTSKDCVLTVTCSDTDGVVTAITVDYGDEEDPTVIEVEGASPYVLPAYTYAEDGIYDISVVATGNSEDDSIPRTTEFSTYDLTITVSPNRYYCVIGTTLNMTASVEGNEDQSVTWEITGSAGDHSIDEDGILTVGHAVGQYTVQATSTLDENKYGTAIISVGQGQIVGHTHGVIKLFS